MRKGGIRAAVLLAALMLVASACTQPNPNASNSPETSPSSEASPSPSPSPTPVGTPPVVSPSPVTEPTPAGITITVATFHPGEVGLAYAPVSVLVAGGTQPYNFTIAGGGLPSGLSMSVVGVTSGTPTKVGTSSFVVKVVDADGLSATATKSITVVPQLRARALCIEGCAVEDGCVTVCGRFGTQSGGLAPYKYTFTAGSDPMPSGLSLKGLTLAGTFHRFFCDCNVFAFSFGVKVTDSLGATAVVNGGFNVFQHIQLFTPGSGCTGDYNTGCTVQLFYSGGAGNITVNTPTVICAGSPNGPCDGQNGQPPPNTLPDGFSASADGEGTVTISFPPGLGNGWQGSIEVTLTDSSPCSPGPVLCSSSPSVVVNVSVAGS